MGVFRPLTDFLQSNQPAGLDAAQPRTHTFRIKQEQRRLSGLLVRVTFNLSTISSATAPDWAAGLVRRLRLKINDFKGPRNVVDLTGPQALSWARWLTGREDRDNLNWYAGNVPGGAGGAQFTGNVAMNFVLPLAHPWFGEPWGNALSIPLSQTFLREDPILEVDIGTPATDIGTAAAITGNVLVQARGYYDNVPEDFAYIAWELRTDEFPWTGSGRLFYEFPSSGWLAQFMLTNYVGAAAATTHAPILAPSGIYQVEYGRNIIDRANDEFLIADNDRSRNAAPSLPGAMFVGGTTPPTSTAALRNIPNEVILDYLAGRPGSDAFSPASIWELNPAALQGDKMRVVYNDVNTGLTNPRTRITHFRFLATEQELLFLTRASS